jgi:hypothetical protein
MASKKLITFYISQVVIPIKHQMNRDALQADLDADWTNEMVDKFLKHNFEIDKSKIEMTTQELHELILNSFQFADSIGLELNYPEDELDKLIDLNIK